MISTIDPSNKTELKRFVSLERKLMKDYPLYISEIDDDVIKSLTKKSLLFKSMEINLFVATKNGNDVARCAAIINKRFQEQKEKGAGFIGFFAASPDCDTEVREMFAKAEQWLSEQGVKSVIAPSNGGAPQSMGFLVNAFDEDPMFPFPWHPPYYKSYIEALEYRPTYPLWYYEIDFANKKFQDAKQRYADNQVATIRPISKKHWNTDIEKITYLLNTCFVNEWEFTRISDDEMKEFFGPMKLVLEPQQILIAEVDGKPVGFCFAIPDLTPLFRSFKGNVGLVSLFKLLTRAKQYKRSGILGIGVLDDYRGKGISKSLAMKLYSHHEKKGLTKSLYYPVNESNAESRGFAESIGGSGRVIYQVYKKQLK